MSAKGFLYFRGHNPTIDILRQKLAALDGAEGCACIWKRRLAAIFTGVLSVVQQGDHVICVRADPYNWARQLFEIILPKFGVETTFVDGTDAANFEKALRPNTRLIYLNLPTPFTFELAGYKGRGPVSPQPEYHHMIDNSYCTPLYQQPHLMGIDLLPAIRYQVHQWP